MIDSQRRVFSFYKGGDFAFVFAVFGAWVGQLQLDKPVKLPGLRTFNLSSLEKLHLILFSMIFRRSKKSSVFSVLEIYVLHQLLPSYLPETDCSIFRNLTYYIFGESLWCLQLLGTFQQWQRHTQRQRHRKVKTCKKKGLMYNVYGHININMHII